MHVHFKIHGSGSDLFGDGMTIWYAKDRMEPGKSQSGPSRTVGTC